MEENRVRREENRVLTPQLLHVFVRCWDHKTPFVSTSDQAYNGHTTIYTPNSFSCRKFLSSYEDRIHVLTVDCMPCSDTPLALHTPRDVI